MKNTQISIAKLEIGNAASEAVRVIAHAAEEAAKVVSAAAAAAATTQTSNVKSSEDHDLLIEVKTKVDALIISVEKLTTRDDLYVLKDDFNLWRNILISGLLLTIAASILLKFFQ